MRKEFFIELQLNPKLELCASDADMTRIRLSGKVVFVDNIQIKQRVFEVSSLVKIIYKTPTNRTFEVSYLEDATAAIAEWVKPPEIFALD